MAIQRDRNHLVENVFLGITSTFFGISFIVLLMDLLFVSSISLVVTVGRVSVIGKNMYTFTGDIRTDYVYIWLLFLVSALLYYILYRTCFHLIVSGVSILGLVLAITGVNVFMNMFLAIPCFMLWLLHSIHGKRVDTVVIGIAYGLAVIEFVKILYLCARLLTGVYPWFNHPVYLNAVIWYALWPVVPTSIVLIVLAGLTKILHEIEMPPQEAWSKLHGYLAMLWRKLPGPVGILAPRSMENEGLISPWLLLGIGLSILVGILPYAPSLNPKGIPVNTDWIYYYRWLNMMIDGDFSVLKIRSDRPLYLLMLYLSWLVTGIDPRTIAIYHNILLFGLYTFSVYLLTRRWMGRKAADIGAIITPFSPIMLSFLYGGFQANLLAISLIFIALSLILGDSRRKLVAGLVLLGIVMFIHEWTWTQYMLVLTIYTVLRIIACIRRRDTVDPGLRILVFFLIVGFTIDLAKHVLLGVFSSASVVEKTTSMIVVEHSYIDSVHWYTTIYTGGSLDNPLFYILALVGIGLLGINIPGVSVVASLAPIVLPNSVVTYRLILNTPLIPLTAYGLSRIEVKLRLLLIISLIGVGLWRLYSIIPGLPLT